MSGYNFNGGISKRGYGEPIELKIWCSKHKKLSKFKDNDIYQSKLCKATFELHVHTNFPISK